MKNCSNEAKKIILQLEKFTGCSDVRLSSSTSVTSYTSSEPNSKNNWTGPTSIANDVGTVVHKLKNYFLVDAFSEEFISYEGIKKLVEVIQQSTGNTRVIIYYLTTSLMQY
jgi:copper chaperone CopZ